MGICSVIVGLTQDCVSNPMVVIGGVSVVFIECILGLFTGLAIIMSDRKLLAELEIERHPAWSVITGETNSHYTVANHHNCLGQRGSWMQDFQFSIWD